MIRLSAATTKIALASLLFAAWPAAAQEVAGVERILAEMPKELAGAPAVRRPNGILSYTVPGPGADPKLVVVLTVMENEGVVTARAMKILTRKMIDGMGLRRVVREGVFTTPKWPDARTFFGNYVTEHGFTGTWDLATDKETMTVLTAVPDRKDAKWAEALVAGQIFNGAVISAGKTAE